MRNSTIDKKEIENFSKMADEWWDKNGKFKPLHKFNPLRIKFIFDEICAHFGIDGNNEQPFKELSLLDIGCGGGLIAEPMVKTGAKVTAIDAGEKNINIAKTHAEKEGLKINYQVATAEQLAKEQRKFDVILNLEVIEHVADVELFMQSCASLLKPNGIMIIATLNRTMKSYALAIIGAEYILNWLPKGTHKWEKFIKPSEMSKYLRKNELNISKMKGLCYNPVSDSWRLTDNPDVNYIISAVKEND
jgi:2-polyprenyl-6-hydroxyphenyl methylase/3-demethylubiquinone-9 3-methyltransferase